MTASQVLLKEEMLAKMEINQERMDGKLDAHHEKVMVRMNSAREKGDLFRKDGGHEFGVKSRRNRVQGNA
jgi:hypothetical protein